MKQLCFILFLSAIATAADINLEDVLHVASDQFTGNFFSDLVKANPGKSVVASPYSIMTPLALLSLASEGPTHTELLNAIGLPNNNITKSVFSFADTKLRSIKGVELKAANKIYIPVNYELNPEFAALSRDIFNSEVQNLNFVDNSRAAEQINKWVEDQTNNRIKDLVSPDTIDINTRAVLVNALYFKGTWLVPFNKSLTLDGDFYVATDNVVKVPMMNNKADYNYGESKKLQSQILELSYVGQETSLMLILPYKTDGINELLETLKDISLLDKETKNMYKIEVDVSIPKFKIETTTDLKKVLQQMNVKRVFSRREAQLSKLLNVDEDLYVSSATQKAFIEVNEEGAEAAAANQFGIAFIGSVILPKEYRFKADHPFVYLLKANNNVIFIGVYYN